MNTPQKWVLILCAVILLGMLLFPPFQAQVQGTVFNLGYHYLAEPPHQGRIPASVNVQMLVLQWLGVALLGAIALLLLKGPQGGAAPAAGSHQPPLDPVAPPAVDQSRTFLGGHHHPWRRYFARMIDTTIVICLLVVALAVLPPEAATKVTANSGAWIWLQPVAWLLALMIPEAALLSSFKTTPGKWIFGIRVTGAHGAPLSFAQAINRSFRVWVQGLWLGVLIIPALLAYRRLNRTGTTLWDAHCGAVVTHRPWTPARAIGAVPAILLVWIVSALITQYSKMPHPSVQATSQDRQSLVPGHAIMGVPANKPARAWWEKYPVISESQNDAGNKAEASNWWEKYPVIDEQKDTTQTEKPDAARPKTARPDIPGADAFPIVGYLDDTPASTEKPAAKPLGLLDTAATIGQAIGDAVTTHAPGAENSEPSGQQPPATPATAETSERDEFPTVGYMAKESFEDGDAAYKRGDYVTALRVWRPLAEQGNAKAQNNLGTMYAQGQGVPQDYVQAVKWYRLAAKQGAALAQNSLGFMYHEGQGVPQDYAEAVKWTRLAAEQGNAGAQNSLGIMYAQGQGVPQDYVQAHTWFILAGAGFPASEAENRNNAVKNRDLVAAGMTPAQVAEAQRLAREWRPKPGGGSVNHHPAERRK